MTAIRERADPGPTVEGPGASAPPDIPPSENASDGPSAPAPDRPGPVRDDRARELSRALFRDLFGPPAGRDFAVRYWDGREAGPRDPAFTLVLREPAALRAMLLPPTERSLGEAYVEGRCDVEGDMEAAVAAVGAVLASLWSPRRLIRFVPRLLELPRPGPPGPSDAPRDGPSRRGRRHGTARDERSVRHHYDVGNDFFRLFLDPWMQYSSGVFADGSASLEEAQEAKMELICRRLDLSPGDRLLDLGCGWGGLMCWAAAGHGVRATGLTLSRRQARAARAAFRKHGVEDRCRVEMKDYRELPADGRFDRAVSVGMVEHVGHRKLPTYFRRVYGALRPGGMFLNQGIVTLESTWPVLRRLRERLLRRWRSFIDEYVFPDGELVTGHERVGPAERAGFEIRRAESSREDYARTLRRWGERLEEHREEATRLVGRPTYRVWRAYMAGSAHGFSTGRIGLLQELYRKPGRAALSSR